MGILDFLKGSAKQAETAAQGAAATGATAATSAEQSAISKLLGEGGGQLTGLLDKLKLGGLDDAVKSWISTGANKAVTADQVKAALGSEQVGAVAKDLGVTEEAAAGKIAQLLPGIIDKLTPDGLVPDATALANKVTGLFKL